MARAGARTNERMSVVPSRAEIPDAASRQDAAVAWRDQAPAYEDIWQQFLALERPRPHRADWAGWVEGRGPHLLVVARVRDTALHRALDVLRADLADVPAIEAHPPHFLHLTVQSCGFLGGPGTAAAGGPAAGALVSRLAGQLAQLPAFEIEIGGTNAFYSAAFLETHSGGRLQQARSTVRAAAGRAVTWNEPLEGFVFHLTVGYLDATAPAERVRRALAPWRTAMLGRILVDELELVQVPTDQREAFPGLSTLARFPLRRR